MSTTSPVGIAGRADISGVRAIELSPAYSGPAAISRAPPFRHIRDVVVIQDRQHVAVLVAVEDNEVEILDLLDEQLAGRKAISDNSLIGVPSCFSGGRKW